MSKLTAVEIALLRSALDDPEAYHVQFDKLVEAKLLTLDPEWMGALLAFDKATGVVKWYA